jgi:hypothetical protein
MTKKIFLFDMDGVLLIPGGYHQSLKASVRRIGLASGVPNVELTDDQIAHFEALSVTNEWDSLAISTALILIKAWEFTPDLRLGNLADPPVLTNQSPSIDIFLKTFNKVCELPCVSAYEKISRENPWLNERQKAYLQTILFKARDIYNSPTLPLHQEIVLGSQAFQSNYGLEPQLNIESSLTVYDRPVMTPDKHQAFVVWLDHPDHQAGILTNRPSSTPPGYLSSPEAELGAKLVGMNHLPLLGSGMLAWFAVTQRQLPDYTFLKPNPVHTLALLQMCWGKPTITALKLAFDLWEGEGRGEDWGNFSDSQMVIFEDAVKGLQSGRAAQALLANIGINIELTLIGVSSNPIKRGELVKIADNVYPDINHINWLKF